jgi:hypothetical protein
MFSFFSKLLSPEQQTIITDKFIIQINDYKYDINDEESFDLLKNSFMKIVFENNLEKVESSNNKYTISFINNNNKKLLVSVFKREYVIELLECINKNTLSKRLELLNLR